MSFVTDASAKAALRLAMRGRRREFVRAHPDADWRAGEMAERLLTGLFGASPRTGTAALYHASGFEMDAAPLGEALRALGWGLALPASLVVDAPVVFRAWTPGERLSPDAVGIAAPSASAPEVSPGMVVAPLLAFDRAGGRLGQGGGYYDRTIAALRAGPNPPAFVGLAFSVQEVAHVPCEPHDQRLDAILTEKAFIPVRKDF